MALLRSLGDSPDSIRILISAGCNLFRYMLQNTFPVDDRRAADRSPDPACRICDGAEVKAVVRTLMAVYFRCHTCNVVWGEPKPHASNFARGWLEGQHDRLRSMRRLRAT
jgi:hypothetical protein